jgi:hypothetical protein
VLRHSLELVVDSEAQAREVHSELSQALRHELGSALEAVFDAACSSDVTLRIDRLELDLGVLARDDLPALLAQRASQRLAAILTPHDGRDPLGPERQSPVRRLAAWEVALERVASFLASGALPARDRWAHRTELEAALVQALEAAPQAVASRLRTLPRDAAARRLAQQFSPAVACEVAAVLAAVPVAEVEATLEGWMTLAATPAVADIAKRSGGHDDALRRDSIEALLVAQLDSPSLSAALRTLVERFVAERASRAGSAESAVAALLRQAQGALAAHTSLRGAIEAVAWAQSAAGSPQTQRGEQDGAQASAAPEEGAATPPAARPPEAMPVSDPTSASRGTPSLEARQAAALSGSAIGPTPLLRSDALRGEARRQEAGERLDGLPASASASIRRRMQAAFAQPEAFQVVNAGLAILWPFLPGLFDTLGLAAQRRFTDDAQRIRAVLLSAHLCDGGEEWDEQDLLLAKVLCGYPPFEPIETQIALSERERNEARALLEAVIGHWSVLKSTSIEGLRSAFLRREGTLTAQEGSWKLEVARAGHDVLLDKLPWGFGLVMLPWMEQPLYVEW